MTGFLATGLCIEHCIVIRPRGHKTFFMLNSTEHEIILLFNVKMISSVGILTLKSRINNWLLKLL